MQMRTTKRIGAFLVLTLSAGVLGACSSQAGPGAGAADQGAAVQEAETNDALMAPGESQSGNPLMGILRDSLAEIELRPAQREAIRALRTDLESKTAAMRTARHELAYVVADGVAAGVIDDSRVNEKQAALVQAVRAGTPAVQDAFNKLHATLDAGQRRALIEKMREKGEAARERMEDRGGPRGVMRAKLGHLAGELQLTDEQKLTIRDRAREEFQGAREAFGPGKKAEVRARLREIGEAFMTDRFDARALEIGREGPDATQKISGALVRFVKIVVPVLTPDQRAKFSAIIKQKADARPAGDAQ